MPKGDEPDDYAGCSWYQSMQQHRRADAASDSRSHIKLHAYV